MTLCEDVLTAGRLPLVACGFSKGRRLSAAGQCLPACFLVGFHSGPGLAWTSASVTSLGCRWWWWEGTLNVGLMPVGHREAGGRVLLTPPEGPPSSSLGLAEACAGLRGPQHWCCQDVKHCCYSKAPRPGVFEVGALASCFFLWCVGHVQLWERYCTNTWKSCPSRPPCLAQPLYFEILSNESYVILWGFSVSLVFYITELQHNISMRKISMNDSIFKLG